MIDQNNISIQEVMRAIYLIANVKKICEWGKVGFTIKRGEIISVWQEQQFIADEELRR
jgi:hypothetical protein